jgi:uncharacterized protein (DUF2141 family)
VLAKSLATASVAALSLFVSAAQAAADTAPAGEPQNVLRVTVEGVKSPRGHIRVDVCPVGDFLKDCRYGGAAPATPGVTTVIVKDLPPGTYAAQAYQDGNDNHSVDRNILGLPTEGVGFSNNAPIGFHPPSFGSAAFSYAGGEQAISFKLRHFAD